LFLEPYVEAGVGGYYVKSTAGSQEETSWRGGYFGGAGINFNLGVCRTFMSEYDIVAHLEIRSEAG
jgi:opacity protein-like surface antigen